VAGLIDEREMGAARRYAARLLANHWQACRSFVGLAGPGRAAMQDSRQLSRGCWCERSLQVRSGGSSSQYAPDMPSSARWNDKQNDIGELASAPQHSEAGWLMAARAMRISVS
jgi:hypothetical protein